jgi:hypothetical protein
MSRRTLDKPDTLNYLKPNGFQFNIDTLPNVSFFCQSAMIPALSIGNAYIANPLVDFTVPGTNLTYDELTIKFIVQENFQNYIELHDWLIGLGFPEERNQYKQFKLARGGTEKGFSSSGDYSDGTLVVLDSDLNKTMEIKFIDCYPTSLQGLEFDISDGNAQYLTAQVTFKYTMYKFVQ